LNIICKKERFSKISKFFESCKEFSFLKKNFSLFDEFKICNLELQKMANSYQQLAKQLRRSVMNESC
jgi:hypothetical protein